MKRDMDLIRKIILHLEEAPFELGPINLEIEGHTPKEISYHVMLLHDAGLIEAMDYSTFGGTDWKPKHLTWEGHEFLEASRDEGRWEKAKNIVREKGGGMALDVLKNVLIRLMTDAVFGS